MPAAAVRHAGRAGALPALLLMLGACAPDDADPGPGGVTVGEARALDEAAEMLDAQRLPAAALEAGDGAAKAPESASHAKP